MRGSSLSLRIIASAAVLGAVIDARPLSSFPIPSALSWGEPGRSPGEDLAGALAGSTIEVVRTQATYFTRAAAFGPRIEDDEGLFGTLIPISRYHRADPRSNSSAMHACPPPGRAVMRRQAQVPLQAAEPESSLSATSPPKDWIALVERGGGCPFVEKVRTAQELGATAVVVGDAPSPDFANQPDGSPDNIDAGLSGKRLLTMFATGDSSDITVPSTFVTRVSGSCAI